MYPFWSLPGPGSFVESIIDDVRVGKNVVLRLPQFQPPGLEAVLRQKVSEESWCWHPLRTTEHQLPLAELQDRFQQSSTRYKRRDIQQLLDSSDFEGNVIWLGGIGGAEWVRWKPFIEEYQHACRNKPESRRSLFIIPLSGEVAQHPPNQEITLTIHSWCGSVSELDMIFYATLLLKGSRLAEKQKLLLATTVAKLSLWDPNMAERLARSQINEILSPIGLLRKIAEERTWTDERAPNWQDGSLNRVDGIEQVHSAYLAATDSKAVDARIWSAQISVIFPLLEEQRRNILLRIQNQHQVPIKMGETIIDNLWDLELGQLAYFLKYNKHPLYPSAARLHRIRNSLAHLENLPPEEAFARELYVPLSSA